MPAKYRRVTRAFSRLKKFSWLAVPLIAVGGLFYPWLGLGVLGIMLALLVCSLLRGKWWCGQVCPHGSLFDVVLIRLSAMRALPRVLGSPLFRWGFFVLFMAMFGVRLYRVFAPGWDSGVWARLGRAFAFQYLLFPTVLGSVLAVAINPRAWCAFCPMGTVQEVLYRLSLRLGLGQWADRRLAWVAAERCTRCGCCGRVCPVHLEPYRQLDAKGDGFHLKCIRCATCLHSCPSRALGMEKTRGTPAASGSLRSGT